MTFRVLVADSLPKEGLERFNTSNAVDLDDRAGISREELLADLEKYDALVVRSRTNVDADVIVVDISGANPNVMYELGVAHGHGKPVVLLSQDTKRIPFDIANYRFLLYDSSEKGLELLKTGLTEALEQLEIEDKKRARLKKYADIAATALTEGYGSVIASALRAFV